MPAITYSRAHEYFVAQLKIEPPQQEDKEAIRLMQPYVTAQLGKLSEEVKLKSASLDQARAAKEKILASEPSTADMVKTNIQKLSELRTNENAAESALKEAQENYSHAQWAVVVLGFKPN